ncbi:uncharacterized protein LOC126562589 [Anopheles maculipalpis]|uniref:uncharacterized protein LOC126562589 n=1 Tax=Anopheles maculipalpis TaxID=1496333 RepID=UPI00215909BE|nr:uncharacterized protein LOC126562589 [Anopheles maculipalpis]
MGSLSSKISPSSENILDTSSDSNPDPRSPTLFINRSPISQEHAGVSRASITKVKDLTSVLAEPSANVLQTPCNLLPKRFQSIVDPRSPSTFNRTPLVVQPEEISDCSLTNVVSSLQYDESTINAPDVEEHLDASFKDCNTQLPDLCNLQIEYDETAPIIDAPNAKEMTIFEDAEVIPFTGNDPRSPSIAIARTPMVLVKHDDGDEEQKATKQNNALQVADLQALEGDAKAKVEKQQRTPQQDNSGRGEQTPKKDKLTPAALRAGNRTPLGCMTNIGTVSNNIRKLALAGQIKQSIIVADEQKLLPRSNEIANSAEKQINRSRIPKLRMS